MGFLGNLKQTISKIDFFHTIELLRYKQQNQYRTTCGGFISITIIVLLGLMFYGKLLDTINKSNIITKEQNINSRDPSPYTISTMPGSKFMIGVEVWKFDLNTGPRYFDVVLSNTQIDLGTYRPRQQIILEPCTTEHWAGFSQIEEKIKRLNMSYWKCLPLNKTYNIQGRYSSDFSQVMDFSIQKCTNKSSQDRPCAPQSDIDQYFSDYGPFYFTIYFTNPIINPASHQFIKYYLQDNNFIMFTQTFGGQMYLYMQDYTITTDQSINPFSDVSQTSGGMISSFAVKNPYEIQSFFNVYCLATIYKSGTSWKFQRSFDKIDQLFSYIGGLFGIITLMFIIINVYNAHSFQIDIADELFEKSENDQKDTLKKYTFFHFLIHKFYELFNMVGFQPSWKKTKNFKQCRKQMLKQLDVSYLVQRVTFLETIIQNVIQPHQIKGIQLHSKPTLQKAKKKRRNFKIQKKISRLFDSNFCSNQLYIDNKFQNQIKTIQSPTYFYQTYSPQGFVYNQSINQKVNNLNQDIGLVKFNKQSSDSINQNRNIVDQNLSDQQSSDQQFQDYQDLVDQVAVLYGEASLNDPVSKKIWDKIKDPVKQKIIKIIQLSRLTKKKQIKKCVPTVKRSSLLPLPKKIHEQIHIASEFTQNQNSQIELRDDKNKKKLRVKRIYNSTQSK